MMDKIDGVYVAENAVITGDVTIGERTNIWPFVCIRGDVAPIAIGSSCSIQDHCMLHCKHNVPLHIADHVIIGHQACVHCKSVGAWTLIGIGSRILDNAVIGSNCLIAAGAVVLPGVVIADSYMAAGVPAKAIRKVTDKDLDYHRDVCGRYVKLAEAYHQGDYTRVGRRDKLRHE